MSIIDPNKPDNDISGGSQHIGIVFKAFASAYEKLSSVMEADARDSTGSGSLLAHIIGGNYVNYVTQRDHLRHVFETTRPYDQPYSAPPPPPRLARPPGSEAISASLLQHESFPKPPPEISGSLNSTPPDSMPPKNSGKENHDTTVVSTEANTKLRGGKGLGVPGTTERQKKSLRETKTSDSKSGTSDSNSIAIEDLLHAGSTASERRAHRVRLLRPDIPNVPSTLTVDEAVKLGGYSNTDAMTDDLTKRQSAVTALKSSKRASENNFPELLGVRRALETIKIEGEVPTDAPDIIKKAFPTGIRTGNGPDEGSKVPEKAERKEVREMTEQTQMASRRKRKSKKQAA